MMSAHYEQEQDANEEKLSELERWHKEKSAAIANAEQYGIPPFTFWGCNVKITVSQFGRWKNA